MKIDFTKLLQLHRLALLIHASCQLAQQEKVSANSLYQRAKHIRKKLKTRILRQMVKPKDNEDK